MMMTTTEPPTGDGAAPTDAAFAQGYWVRAPAGTIHNQAKTA
jgi:hypothetical protein